MSHLPALCKLPHRIKRMEAAKTHQTAKRKPCKARPRRESHRSACGFCPNLWLLRGLEQPTWGPENWTEISVTVLGKGSHVEPGSGQRDCWKGAGTQRSPKKTAGPELHSNSPSIRDTGEVTGQKMKQKGHCTQDRRQYRQTPGELDKQSMILEQSLELQASVCREKHAHSNAHTGTAKESFQMKIEEYI